MAPRGPTRGGPVRAPAPGAARLLSPPADAESVPRWGLGDVAIGLTPFFLVALTILAGGGGDDTETEITIGALVANSLLLWVFLVGVPAIATHRKGNGLVADLGLRFRGVDAGAFLLGVALQALVVPALYWPLIHFTGLTEDDVSGDARELVDAASGPTILVLVLVVCVGAPLAEEIFFRGLLLRSVDKRWGIGAAVVASAIVFAASHLMGVQFPALLLFGAVVSVLAVRSGRLGPGILCHAGFNAWTVFQLLVIDR
jgi:membrane protease YdiL (CAAX protease family)